MAGIGVLVEDNGQTEYVYKIKVPTGSAGGGATGVTLEELQTELKKLSNLVLAVS